MKCCVINYNESKIINTFKIMQTKKNSYTYLLIKQNVCEATLTSKVEIKFIKNMNKI